MATLPGGGEGRCCTLHRPWGRGACLVKCLNKRAPNPQPSQPLPPLGFGSTSTPSWSSHRSGAVVHLGVGDTSCRRNWAMNLPASGWKTGSPTPSEEVPSQLRPCPDLAWRPNPLGWQMADLWSVRWVPRMASVNHGVSLIWQTLPHSRGHHLNSSHLCLLSYLPLAHGVGVSQA